MVLGGDSEVMISCSCSKFLTISGFHFSANLHMSRFLKHKFRFPEHKFRAFGIGTLSVTPCALDGSERAFAESGTPSSTSGWVLGPILAVSGVDVMNPKVVICSHIYATTLVWGACHL